MEIDGEKMETMRDYFGGSKITADGDCSHEIKRCLLLGRKAIKKCIKKCIKMQRYYFANKGLSCLLLVFPVVMYGCAS